VPHQLPLWEHEVESDRVEVAPGAVWLRGHLSIDDQRALITQSQEFLNGPAGGYVPVVRGGGRMHVRMVCLGRHWNAMTYQYGPTRSDYDNLPAVPLPASWRDIATRAATMAGFSFTPDICIVNEYGADGRMGLHQDKGESERTLASGAPVVSFSIGDTGRFLFGGLGRRDRYDVLMLASGDAFVFGGSARLRYHGVSRILEGTAPASLGLSGRLNLTFRQY
jgi:alkylated DNA repair protein (DNA oxidative demethylase)